MGDAEIPILVAVTALVCALPLIWWLARRQGPAGRPELPAERLDTLVGWPPEPTRILRSSERLAFSTLKLALPGYLILAQVPLARFLTVPKRNSYAEWMRRLGNQCVDFVICDVTSQTTKSTHWLPSRRIHSAYELRLGTLRKRASGTWARMR